MNELDPWAEATADIPALLDTFRADPGDPEEAIEVLAASQRVRRYARVRERPAWLSELAHAVSVLAETSVILEGLKTIQPARWRIHADAIRPSRESSVREAGRLFRQLDDWRLALVGARWVGVPATDCTKIEGELGYCAWMICRDPTPWASLKSWATAHTEAFLPLLAMPADLLATLDIWWAIRDAKAPADES